MLRAIARNSDQNAMQVMVYRVTLIAWCVVFFYAIFDFVNGSYFSTVSLLLNAFIVLPLIYFLNRSHKNLDIVRFMLIFSINISIFISTAATPFDDGGRFYFAPISVVALMIFEPHEIKKIIVSLLLPLLLYFLSLNISLPSYDYVIPTGVTLQLSKSLSFLGVYCLTLIVVYFFISYIRELKFKSIEQSKFSALGVMASGIAHEINNPLTLIRGRAEKIQLQQNLDKNIVKDLVSIVETTERISKIIKGLKTFSRDANEDTYIEISALDVVKTSLDLDVIPYIGARVTSG